MQNVKQLTKCQTKVKQILFQDVKKNIEQWLKQFKEISKQETRPRKHNKWIGKTS